MQQSSNAFGSFAMHPLQDELLYGWLARHRAVFGLTESRQFEISVLGDRRMGGSILLPTNLRHLSRNLPREMLDYDGLVSGHTVT